MRGKEERKSGRLEKDDGRYREKELEAYVYYVLDGRGAGDVVLLTGLSRGEVERLVREGGWDEERSRAKGVVGCSGVEYLRRRGLMMGAGLVEGAAAVCGEVVRKVMDGEVEVRSVEDIERVGRLMRNVVQVGEVSMGIGGKFGGSVVGSGGGRGKWDGWDGGKGIDRGRIEGVRERYRIGGGKDGG
jgi:hypothetical protein